MLDGRRVLVFEDEALIGEDLRQRLTRMGLAVTGPVRHGSRAVVLTAGAQPDLVLMDIHLADGSDGVDAARRIRDAFDVPVVFLTGHSDDATLKRAAAVAPAAYLPKPVSDVQLRVTIPTVLERHRIDKRAKWEAEARENSLRDAAMRDPLTRQWNRAAILQILESETCRASRHRRSLAVLMIDVDRFKSINDTHGHVVGDAVLREVSARLGSVLRPYDALGRFGGDEFLVVSPEDSRHGGQLAARLRAAVAESPIVVGDQAIHVTVSVGVCAGPYDTTPNALARVELADRALYEDKRTARALVPVQRETVDADLLRRIEGEFTEMSGLSLTPSQAGRLWGLDAAQCCVALDKLTASGFLTRTRAGQFVRR